MDVYELQLYFDRYNQFNGTLDDFKSQNGGH